MASIQWTSGSQFAPKDAPALPRLPSGGLDHMKRRSSRQVLSAFGARRMSNAFTATGVRASFPPVTINKTLYDFLKEELGEGEEMETHCCVKPHSEPAFGESVPLSRKYLIHCAQVGQSDDLAHLQLEICSSLLHFFGGPMKLAIIGCEGNSQDKSLWQQAIYRNAINNFTVLQESQRPEIMAYGNKDDFWVNHDGSKVRFSFGMDMAERVPCVFAPELTYLLNSKRWLCKVIAETQGDLPAPNDVLIDTEIECPVHKTKADFWYNGGRGCAHCVQGIRDEVDRVGKVLAERPLPYVLKLTQSLSSVGTNIVTTEDQRSETSRKIRRILLDYLPRITKDNAHMYTMTLIMSDLIPGRTMAMNFFVRKNGECVFSGACHQLATGMTGRQNTAITYADQEKLEIRYRDTLAKISKILADAGYYGQVGVDIMEDDEGNQYIIDANVRTALSMMLYQLRGHFERHGHKMAMVYECIFMSVPREEFEENFAAEFEEARIVILGGTRLGNKNVWGFGMVLAGEDKAELDELSDRILKLETKAHTVPQE